MFPSYLPLYNSVLKLWSFEALGSVKRFHRGGGKHFGSQYTAIWRPE
jgi:hypothetical protein